MPILAVLLVVIRTLRVIKIQNEESLGILLFHIVFLSRVLNVLHHWVEFHYYDFERDPKLLEKLERFVNSVRSRNMQKWVTSIHRALKKVWNTLPTSS